MNNIQIKSSFKTLMTITSISVLSLSYAYAEVTLDVDDNIKVTAINGNEINQSAFQPLIKQFKLQPGRHVITAKYDRLYDLQGDNHDYLRSGNVTVSADMQDNQTYQLAMPGQPEDYEKARDYAKTPTLAVMHGSTTIAKVKGTSGNSSIFSGLAGIIGVGNSAQASNQRTIAAINLQPATQSVPLSDNASTLDKFMKLWLQATPDEREKIRLWVDK